MAEVVWSETAAEDLDAIIDFVEIHDKAAARKLRSRLRILGESLADFPDRGRPAGDGKRELTSVPPYILRYRVTGDRVVILGVRHGRQRPLD